MEKRRKFILSVLVVLLCFVELSQAAPITIQISGNVTSASGSALPDTIYEGVTFTGTYTYDSSTIDSEPTNQKLGAYWHNAPYGINVSLGGYEFKTDPTHIEKFLVCLDLYYGNGYYYTINSYQNISLPTGITVEEIRWVLGDGTRSAISSDILPITEPILTDWNYNVFRIIDQDNFSIEGTVTQVVLIPEPASIFMLTMGIFCFRRKR